MSEEKEMTLEMQNALAKRMNEIIRQECKNQSEIYDADMSCATVSALLISTLYYFHNLSIHEHYSQMVMNSDKLLLDLLKVFQRDNRI